VSTVTIGGSIYGPKRRVLRTYLTDVRGSITVKTGPKGGTKVRLHTPTNMREVQASPQVKEWVAAIQREMDGLHAKGVFTKTQRKRGMRTIPTRFVFKIKTDHMGDITKWKARLVAKGFFQQKGTDFTESYAPTSSAVAIRAAIAIATAYDLEIEHLDVTQAFLNAKIDRDLFVEPAEGDPTMSPSRDFVYKLNYALYGLVQAPLLWSQTLRDFLVGIGFKPVGYEGTTYVLHKDGQKVIIVTYVDDLQVLYHNTHKELADWVKSKFAERFDITDEGSLTWHLGVHYVRDRAAKTTYCHQTRYLESVLEKHGYQELKPRDTPWVSGTRLSDTTPATALSAAAAQAYREQLGSLMCCKPTLSLHAQSKRGACSSFETSLSLSLGHQDKGSHLPCRGRHSLVWVL
jgi:hypothetical protein